MATHSSILAWRIPGTKEPSGLLSMGSHRIGHDGSDLAAAATDQCGQLAPGISGNGRSILCFGPEREIFKVTLNVFKGSSTLLFLVRCDTLIIHQACAFDDSCGQAVE